MATVGRRSPPDVDRDIEDRSGADPDELGLGGWRKLEMQAAHDAAIDRQRKILLHKRNLDPVLAQRRLAKDLGEETAQIVVADRPQLLHFGDVGRDDLHAGEPSTANRSNRGRL